jgi:hypothetical protein
MLLFEPSDLGGQIVADALELLGADARAEEERGV